MAEQADDVALSEEQRTLLEHDHTWLRRNHLAPCRPWRVIPWPDTPGARVQASRPIEDAAGLIAAFAQWQDEQQQEGADG